MKEVEFVKIKSELVGYGLGKGTKYRFIGIEDIIKEKIIAGWEYSGYVPFETRGVGDIETSTLIFQKDK